MWTASPVGVQNRNLTQLPSHRKAERTAVTPFYFQHLQPSRWPPSEIQQKRPQRREITDTKPRRRQCLGTKATLFTWLPRQPRLHSRLHIRSMNQGGHLGPTDSKASADTEDAEQARRMFSPGPTAVLSNRLTHLHN